MIDLYVLDEKLEQPVLEPDSSRFWQWMAEKKWEVARDEIEDLVVYTMFLGWERWPPNEGGPPILWITAVLVPAKNIMLYERGCAGDRERALAMHAKMVAFVKALKRPENSNPPLMEGVASSPNPGAVLNGTGENFAPGASW